MTKFPSSQRQNLAFDYVPSFAATDHKLLYSLCVLVEIVIICRCILCYAFLCIYNHLYLSGGVVFCFNSVTVIKHVFLGLALAIE